MDATAQAYEDFAATATDSPTYVALCAAVARDARTLAWLRTLPREKRQPNLLLGALRWWGAPLEPEPALAYVAAHHADLEAVIATRRTQTNEVGRCGAIALALSRVPGPVALVEVGASAGLNLLLDRYRIAFGDGRELGPADSLVRIEVPLEGLEAPTALPEVAWRAGLDANPLDPADPDVRRWLGCLVWPEDAPRRARLDAALELAAQDPPRVVAADAAQGTADLLAEVPAGLTAVVVHTVVFPYLDPAVRTAVRDAIAAGGAHELALEPPGDMAGVVGGRSDHQAFVLSLDGEPLARAHSHGRWIRPLER